MSGLFGMPPEQSLFLVLTFQCCAVLNCVKRNLERSIPCLFLLLFVISCASVRFTEYMNRRICIERLVPCLIISIPFFIILKLRWLHERITTAMVLSLFLSEKYTSAASSPFLTSSPLHTYTLQSYTEYADFQIGGGRRAEAAALKTIWQKKGWGGRIAAKDIGHHPLSLSSRCTVLYALVKCVP